jgi:hypothetical protein
MFGDPVFILSIANAIGIGVIAYIVLTDRKDRNLRDRIYQYNQIALATGLENLHKEGHGSASATVEPTVH